MTAVPSLVAHCTALLCRHLEEARAACAVCSLLHAAA
jgi:hypothetical protein